LELAQRAATVNRMAAELGARIEEARKDRRTRDLVLAAMDEGIVLLAPNGDVQYANPTASRLVGRIAAEGSSTWASDEAPIYVPPILRSLAESAPLLVLRDVREARRVDAIRRDFVAAASHELKTPVASIQAAAETLEHALDEDPVAARRFVGNLLRDAERLSRIVLDLLDLSRLESERGPLEPVRLDLLAREEAERIGDRVRDADLSLDVAASPVTVQGSRKDLALLFSNLLDNAVRYTRPGGTIRVEVAASNGRVQVAVSDTGIGIPARDLPRIFERFYRVDRARSRETGGTGLGLAIVKHVAEQHGGSVEAASELGSGTTFRVSVPAS
jgi:signal transduction histidine kinase